MTIPSAENHSKTKNVNGLAVVLNESLKEMQKKGQLSRVQNDCEDNSPKKSNHEIIKPTFKRYIILFLFCINSGNKAFQWIQISASTKKISYYYDVENYVINATSVIFMLSFLFISWPACFVIDRIGLRRAVLLGSFGTAVGSVIKCFTCHQGGIVLLFVSQIIVSLSEQLIFSVPPRLASVWFPDHQVSTAMGLSILGNQLGVALGFIVPQSILDQRETRDDIGRGLYVLFLATAILSVVSFLADVVLFDEAPKHPPGIARFKQIQEEKLTTGSKSLIDDMNKLARQVLGILSNRQLVILSISTGINVGNNGAIATLLNQVLDPIWPGADIFIGNAGFCFILFGALGSALWGKILDKTHKYLLLNIFLTITTCFSLVFLGFSITELKSQIMVYVALTLLGLFQVGLMVSSMEFAVELTYPAPELVTASCMNITPQIFGTAFVFLGSYIVDKHGTIASIVYFLVCAIIALVLLLLMKETLNRQNAVENRNIDTPRQRRVSDRNV